jgi:hypothetical protein
MTRIEIAFIQEFNKSVTIEKDTEEMFISLSLQCAGFNEIETLTQLGR